jgi:hypothetical protein
MNKTSTLAVALGGKASSDSDLASEFAELSTEELRDELARSLDVTVQSLVRVAWIVRTLEERGEDLSELQLCLLHVLRRIAFGQVLPELVIRFAAQPALLNRVQVLPIPDQRRLASGEPIELVIWTAENGFDRRNVNPILLSREQMGQVFGPEGVRPEAEQIALLEARGRPKSKPAPPQVGRIHVDQARGGLRIGKTFIPQGDVLDALAKLRGAIDPDSEPVELDAQCNVRLSGADLRRIKQRALDSNMSANALIRRALIVAGLIGPLPEQD